MTSDAKFGDAVSQVNNFIDKLDLPKVTKDALKKQLTMMSVYNFFGSKTGEINCHTTISFQHTLQVCHCHKKQVLISASQVL